MESALLLLTSDGPEVTSTNYFESAHARAGFLYLSGNANVWRLLVPDKVVGLLTEISAAQRATICKAKHEGRDVAQILIFDNQPEPYAITVSVEQVDRDIRPPGVSRMLFYVRDPDTPLAVRKVLDIPCRTL